ncbi:hypothetical protein ANCCEY_08862 [Ancylostoma ceylanicum]|uniref:Transmembrane protein 144 n=1 Tax=Ancylostoma ceylanicum TaxID=53326 RepID=A0A0D6LWR3_9BILA|nr:hypothetical protein ANCCEY_08862 [Ancylostoma ceylanicum]
MTSAVIGLAACGLSSVFFGSAFVPVKKFDAGNGVFVQWVMATAILSVGLAIQALEGFPKFQPLAMLGGVFWALGNVTAIPIMSVLGLGMGMLIWGATNCITGWAVGSGFCFSQIRPSVRTPSHLEVLAEERVIAHDDTPEEASPLISPTPSVGISRQTKRILAILTALMAGVFYGVTFVPVIYIQDHPEKNNPVVNSRIIGPSMMAGCMWSVAQSSWFVANDNLSQSVTFPIISMVPGVCAAMWSVFYFKEITGKRNLNILVVAIATTLNEKPSEE